MRSGYGLGTAEGGAARGGRVRRRRPPPRAARPECRRGERLLCERRALRGARERVNNVK